MYHKIIKSVATHSLYEISHILLWENISFLYYCVSTDNILRLLKYTLIVTYSNEY